MTVSVNNADSYFAFHKLRDVWEKAYLELEPEKILTQAENMLKNTFNLRQGAEGTTSYEHAVYEQAIHILSYDEERYLTQSQGVKLFSYDGIQVQQSQSLISPIAFMFLKKHIYRKVGDIR
jgi:hypothetical protein